MLFAIHWDNDVVAFLNVLQDPFEDEGVALLVLGQERYAVGETSTALVCGFRLHEVHRVNVDVRLQLWNVNQCGHRTDHLADDLELAVFTVIGTGSAETHTCPDVVQDLGVFIGTGGVYLIHEHATEVLVE